MSQLNTIITSAHTNVYNKNSTSYDMKFVLNFQASWLALEAATSKTFVAIVTVKSPSFDLTSIQVFC